MSGVDLNERERAHIAMVLRYDAEIVPLSKDAAWALLAEEQGGDGDAAQDRS